MFNSVDTEKATDKIQHLVVIGEKHFREIRIDKNFLTW